MKPLFARNLSNAGRLVRGPGAVGLLIGAGSGFFESVWLGVGLAACLRCLKPCVAGV